MKKLLLSLVLIALIIDTYSQENEFSLQNQADQKIRIIKSFIESSLLEPFIDADPISGLVISGDITLNSDSSLVRIILIDDHYNEYLVFESYTLITDSWSSSIDQIGEETTLLNYVVPTTIRIEIIDASIFLKEIITSKADTKKSVSEIGDLRQQQMQTRINKINENLKKRNIPWIAGETSISQMTYEEKKAYFGEDLPNLYGFEYYTGGIFVMPGVLDAEDETDYNSVSTDLGDSPYVKEFSWRDVHGQDWVTPVKNQSQCGSCWAFGATGATELMVNLYYNQKLDLDLSEQQLVSCSGTGSCSGGYTYRTVDYIRRVGIVEEDCFPYRATDMICNEMCKNPTERIRIGGYINHLERTDDNIRKVVLQGAATFSIIPWRHSITLCGFKTLNAGDKVYIKSSTGTRWVTIDNSSSLIGKTAWLIKNSWGTWWGDRGFAYVVTNLSDINPWHTCQLIGSVTSMNYNTSDIACLDNDGDGYYTWGIGPKPAHCPPCPDEPDGDDSNACFGPRDEYGNLQSFTTPEPSAEDATIFEGQMVPNLTAEGNNIKWYSDYKLNNLVYAGNSFATGHTSKGIYTYYVTQTLSDCESVPKAVHLIILEGVSPPETNDVEVCFGDQRLIKATGENIRWYSDTDLKVLVYEGNNYTPTVTEPAVYSFYITQTIEGIESPPSNVTYTIKQPPGPINAEDKVFCSDEGLFMYAYGENINWYTGEFSNELFDERNNRTYKIVSIGKQVWMAENLDIGVQINGTTESSDNGIIEKYYYNDDPAIGSTYGGLYQWQELMNYSTIDGSQGICPAGWHIPSNEDWKILEMELGMSQDDVDVLGIRGTDQGLQLREGGSSGFEALMAGKREPEGTFTALEYYATFWNSSGYNRTVSVHFDQVFASTSLYDTISNGFSVRCIMDDSSYVIHGNRLDVSSYNTGDYTFRVTSTYEGCESVPDTVSLSIHDTPPPPTVGDYEYCLDEEYPILTAVGENIKWYQKIVSTDFIDERDEQQYKMVQIGNQVWMAENLDFGIQINGKQESTDNEVVEKYYYNNDPTLGSKLGGLYQWEELMDYTNTENTQGICPAGWEVPSNKDWMQLEMYLGMNQAEATLYGSRGTDQGAQLKEGGSSGFSALMGGKRTPEGVFVAAEDYTTFWNSSAYNRTLSIYFDQIFASKSKYDPITNAFSVRCLMNDSSYTTTGNQMISKYIEPGIYKYAVTQTIDGCESESAIINLTLREKPVPPQGQSISLCDGEVVPELDVKGENIRWYADIGSDTLVHAGNLYIPNNLTLGLNTYYVTQSDSYCESEPSLISIELKHTPDRPKVTDISACFGDLIPNLVAEGDAIKWYNDENLLETLHTGSDFATDQTDTGIYNYYVTQTVDGCESLAETSTLTINPIPVAPIATDTAICEGDSVPLLVAFGENLQWYGDSNLSNLLQTGNTYATGQTVSGYYSYYVTSTVKECESPATITSLNVKDLPIAPAASGVSVCEGDPIPVIVARGDSIKWYSDAELKYLIQSDSTLQVELLSPGLFTYYATQTRDGCEGPPQDVDVLIKEVPSAPYAPDVQICEGDEIPVLFATGDSIKWYDNSTLDNMIYMGNKLRSLPTATGSHLFYVTQTQQACEGNPVEVELLIKELPIISLGNDTVIRDDQDLIMGPFPVEYTYLWSNTTKEPYLNIVGEELGAGEHWISVQVSSDGCVFKDTIVITIESTIGISQLSTSGCLKVYPNPTEDFITVEFTEEVSESAILEIFDARGALVQKYRVKELYMDRDRSIKIYLKTTGPYYLQIYNDDQIYNRKVIRY